MLGRTLPFRSLPTKTGKRPLARQSFVQGVCEGFPLVVGVPDGAPV
jgi:hypothetical protein